VSEEPEGSVPVFACPCGWAHLFEPFRLAGLPVAACPNIIPVATDQGGIDPVGMAAGVWVLTRKQADGAILELLKAAVL